MKPQLLNSKTVHLCFTWYHSVTMPCRICKHS